VHKNPFILILKGFLYRIIDRLTADKWFYVNLTCMEYTSNFYDKPFLPNGTIKEEEGYYEETSF